ncbi:MAG TPA: hypothetical protein DD471_15575 [Planctomycetes bacterium]|jgi:hypothetical protein|nr:hypothetical protein [Planctomycetota bacterium]
MDNVLGTLKGLIRDVTEVGVYLLALGVVAGVLFGPGADGGGGAFYGDVVKNITGLVSSLGSQGLTGLLSLAVILYLFKR